MKTFDVVLMDPPWSFNDGLLMSNTKRGSASNYKTMTLDELKTLPIKNIANIDGCIFAMWCPSALLKEGIELMETYGFKLKQSYVWIKVKKSPLDDLKTDLTKSVKRAINGEIDLKDIKDMFSETVSKFSLNNILSLYMGKIFRNTHEICLIGTNTNKVYKKIKNHSQRTVCIAKNLGHSRKPDDLHQALDLIMGKDANKCEIFARRQYSGWKCIGNEIDGLDIREAIAKLL
jgi:N6-adenosine-specific RNA methylase IME4